MMNFFRRYMKPILLITAGVLIIGTFAMYGANFIIGGADTVATVNGVKVPAQKYFKTLSSSLQSFREKEGREPDEASLGKMKEEILRDFVQEELFLQEAKKLDLGVSRQELIGTIQNYNSFKQDNRFSPELYYNVLRTVLRTTPAEFEEDVRKRIITGKLRNLIVSPVKVTERELEDEYSRTHNGEMKDYAKEREKFAEKFLNEKRFFVLNTWFAQIGEKAKIKITLDKVEKAAARA